MATVQQSGDLGRIEEVRTKTSKQAHLSITDLRYASNTDFTDDYPRLHFDHFVPD